VSAKAPFAVVILPVDVARDHSAERDVLGPGRDGRKPPARDEEAIDIDETEARLGTQDAGRRVEREDPIGEARAGNLVFRACG
jgi:hypothetical protein